ncbi:LOW QUALITY PROTEIN: hypothetical protein PHMEG_0005407 [Phytophthora megakarya]|uniref:Uncharacterized protein n=1 Tax=Phytophthora megakarya TaxID=4795 RepID=A0A225WT12_9STRA|nr:LOW QUALITY PROTEIN: hypothetical protein PHMEG_0005407 [Phytophthora megakarya]
MEPTQQPEERLAQEEVKRLTSEAMIGKRISPPVVQYPEAKQGGSLLSVLFKWPVIVCVPGCLHPSRKPFCPMPGCSCTPSLKQYKQRVVEEVDAKFHLLYIKYQCQGESKGCFFNDFNARETQLIIHFPFVLTKKHGISKSLMELVHEGMLSPHGLSSTVDSIKRRREKRYYKLLCLFAAQVRQTQLWNPLYFAPSPPSAAQFCSTQCPLGPETLSAAWLQMTRIYSSLCEVLMKTTKVKKTLRVDHSVKFCKKLKVWPGGTGKCESMRDAKMLLLLQNEIGQIVGRCFTWSENNDETRELLEHVKGSFPDEGEVDPCYVISDNANSVRAMVQDVLGTSVGVLQDPFHVIQRFTEKVKDKPVRKYLAKQLHEAIYDIDGQLRVPSEMAVRVEAASNAVLPKDVGCSDLEWHGTLNSNLQQIRRGDLEVATNTYNEGGERLSASNQPTGGVSFCIKKLLARSVSAEVGLRILDVFNVRHNLKVGTRYGRNPPLQHADLFTLAQTASCCHGAFPESPELEYVSNLMSFPHARPQYRSTTDHDFEFEERGQLLTLSRLIQTRWSSTCVVLTITATTLKSCQPNKPCFRQPVDCREGEQSFSTLFVSPNLTMKLQSGFHLKNLHFSGSFVVNKYGLARAGQIVLS